MKKLPTLFVHSGSLSQVYAVFALVSLLYKLQVVDIREMVDARSHNVMMGAT